MQADPSASALLRYFAGLAEFTFEARLGVVDPPLVDYVAELLTRFVHSDAVFSIRNPRGRRLAGVADMVAEANARVGEARREAYRQIGDFTLFWTGVYPEALKRLQDPTAKDHLVKYSAEGKRSYYVASTIPSAADAPDAVVLQRLSTQFDLCAYGLGEVRREWERREGDSMMPLIVLGDL
ncbi:MAG: hypothetical protein WD176_06900 [Pirellulales bacterium]